MSGSDLANMIRMTYPHRTSLFLWLMAELAVICADTQEVIGSAVGLKLLLGIPLKVGVVLTILISLVDSAEQGVLHLQKYGQRIIEAIFAAFVGVMGVCFFVNYLIIGYARLTRPPLSENFFGLLPFVRASELPVALSLLGSIIMPQNLYLHSSLVLSRDVSLDR